MAEIETQRLEGYRRLIEIARDLASTLDLDELLDRIVYAATEITEAEAGSILLYDGTARRLYFQTATNIDQQIMRGLNVPLEGSIAGWIVSNREPVRTPDVHTDERFFGDIEETVGFATKSLLGVPLITKEKVVGVLEVLNKKRGTFSEADESLLLVLGSQAAVAIENSRLFQQSDLISEFVHELRTPLASLSTATYLLMRPELRDEQRAQIIGNLHSEALHLNALATSFLDLARLESGRVQFRKTRFDVRDLLTECNDMLQAKADAEQVLVTISLPADLPLLEADRDKIRQVLINLLSNAIKYNRPKGTVLISAEASVNEIALSIEDSGIGIPVDALPHLFEKFYRVREHETKTGGTGLGLSICRQIIQGHNGSIEVKNKTGVGTTFTVHLPRAPKTVPRQ